MFYESYVHPRIKYVLGGYDVYISVNWNRNGKFDHYGEEEYLGRIYDDDYIDICKLIEAMDCKTRLEATELFDNAIVLFGY